MLSQFALILTRREHLQWRWFKGIEHLWARLAVLFGGLIHANKRTNKGFQDKPQANNVIYILKV